MEALRFTLSLEDRLSGAAKAAAEVLGRVQKQGDKAQQTANGFAKELERAKANLDKLKADPKGYKQLIQLQRQLADERKKLATQHGGFWSGFTEKLPFRTIAQYTQAAFVGELMAEGVKKAGELLVEAGRKVVEVITDGFKDMVRAGTKQQSLQLGERLSLGRQGAKEFQADADRFASLTGFDDDDIRKMLLPLRRLGFDQKQARAAFAAAGDLAAGLGEGGNQGTVEGILEMFTKIKAKGGISEKMLDSLKIINSQDFFKRLGKRLGVSDKEAKDRSTTGKVDPNALIDEFEAAIERGQGGKLGTGTVAFSNTLEAKLKKLRELPENYFKKIAESPSWQKLTDAAGKFLDKLDPDGPIGKRIFPKLEAMFSQIVGWIEQLGTDEGLDKFIAGLENVLSAVQKIVEGIGKIAGFIADNNKSSTAGGLSQQIANVAEGKDNGIERSLELFSPVGGVMRAVRSSHATVNVTVNGAKGEDAEKIGKGIAKSAHGALEKGAQERGAQ